MLLGGQLLCEHNRHRSGAKQAANEWFKVHDVSATVQVPVLSAAVRMAGQSTLQASNG